MGLIDNIRSIFSPKKEERSFTSSNFFSNITGTVASSKEQAMSIAAVTACVRAISTAVASLPLNLYRKDGVDKNIEKNHILYKLVHDNPNKINTSYNWRVQQMINLLLEGNSYSVIVRDNRGTPVEIIPLVSDNVRVIKYEEDLFYEVQGVDQPLSSYNVLHVSGLSFDGCYGYSPIQMYAQTIGLGVKSREFASNFFSNGGNISGYLTSPSPLKPEVVEQLRFSWNQKYSGVGNSHNTAVLPNGLEYHRMNLSPADGELIKQMEFTREEIASIFAVPPSQIGIMRDSSSRANVEEQSIMFYRNCLLPYLINWEQELNKKLLRDDEKDSLFFEFNASGILRGDIQSRYNSYAIAIQNGWLNRNEVRELENLNTQEGLSEYLVPLNMADVSKEETNEE